MEAFFSNAQNVIGMGSSVPPTLMGNEQPLTENEMNSRRTVRLS